LATVKEESSMFTIKNSIEIKDCFGKVLYTSQVGKSKEKGYKVGYQEAIRNAYESMTDFKYSYNPDLVNVKKEASSGNVISEKGSVPVKTNPIVVLNSDDKTALNKDKKVVYKSIDFLYSKSKRDGFDLVNTKSEVVFFILKTNVKDVFIIKDKNGIMYKVGGNYVAEFYENNQLIVKEYQIKF
jgi:hypothetical protein